MVQDHLRKFSFNEDRRKIDQLRDVGDLNTADRTERRSKIK